MLNKSRVALNSVVGGYEGNSVAAWMRQPKFPYSRPEFLQLSSEDELLAAADHSLRPIIVPRHGSRLPWHAGYAEAVNAGKSAKNEDNAHAHCGVLREVGGSRTLPYFYFGIFDGHSGHGASTAAARQLHRIIHEKLQEVVEHLLQPSEGAVTRSHRVELLWVRAEELSVDKLVTGALEAAFHDMDALIAADRRQYELRGGCTALAALFLLGRLYLANAGDSRALLCRRGRAMVASHDFTPETERQRLRQLASQQPHLVGGEFTHLDFGRRVTRADLGRRLLYRDAHMTGWAYKTVTEEDVKPPVVGGEGKRSRLCSTIGVTRGFGDHDLRAQRTSVYLKPFLLSQPEVLVVDLRKERVTSSDMLVLATDGLWDVTPNWRVAEIVERSLSQFPEDDQSLCRYRCVSAAQELVMSARGKLEDRFWRRSDGSAATVDDISVFVIPLRPYELQFQRWQASGESGTSATESPGTSVPVVNGVSTSPLDSEGVPAANAFAMEGGAVPACDGPRTETAVSTVCDGDGPDPGGDQLSGGTAPVVSPGGSVPPVSAADSVDASLRQTAADVSLRQTAADAADVSLRQTAAEAAEASLRQMAAEAADASLRQTAAEAADVSLLQTAADAADVSLRQTAAEAADASLRQTAAEAADVSLRQTAAEAADVSLLQTAADAADASLRQTAAEAADVSLRQTAADAMDATDASLRQAAADASLRQAAADASLRQLTVMDTVETATSVCAESEPAAASAATAVPGERTPVAGVGSATSVSNSAKPVDR